MCDTLTRLPYDETKWRELAQLNLEKSRQPSDDLDIDREWARFQELPAHVQEVKFE